MQQSYTDDQLYDLMTQLCVQDVAIVNQNQALSLNVSDWTRLWDIAIQHKIGPLLSQRLLALNLNIPDALKHRANQHRNTNLQIAFSHCAELVKLNKLFASHNVNYLVFKGVGLSRLLGSDLSLRHVGDVDILLVDKQQFELVDELLYSIGYSRSVLGEKKRLASYQVEHIVAKEKDVVYYSEKSKIVIELHLRLTVAFTSFPVPTAELYERRSYFKVGTTSIPVMSIHDHGLYLIIHSSLVIEVHRLKWYFDILNVQNSTLYNYDSLEFEPRVNKLRVRRSVVEGLMVANAELAMPVPKWVGEYYMTSWITRQFVARARQKLRNQISPEDGVIRNMLHRFYFIFIYAPFSTEGWAHKVEHMKGYLLRKSDWNVIELPENYHFLYYFTRPFIWIVRLIKGR